MGNVQNMEEEIKASHKVLRAQLVELHQKLDRSNQDTSYATSADLSKALTTMVHAVETMTKDSRLIHRTESILRGLKFENLGNRQSQILGAHQKTFPWALSEKSSLASWFKGNHGVYWIQGKAGSGKSTLMKYLESEKKQVLELLRAWAGDDPILLASHYFWAIGTSLQNNIEGLLRTLLFRIFVQEPTLLENVCSEKLQSYLYLEPWTFEELRKCVMSLSKIPDLPTKFCFLIDGLDEYRGHQEELLELIKVISSSTSMKLCVSSRPWPQFAEAFGSSPWQLSVHDLTRNDIHRYVVDKLGANSRYIELEARHPQQTASLTQEITQVADGVFLWVYFAIRDLLRGLAKFDSLSDLVARLKGIPKNLEDYFARMLDSIDEDDYIETSVILVMVAATESPLTTLHTWAARKSREVGDETRSLLYRNFDAARITFSQEAKANGGRIPVNSPSDHGYHGRDEKRRLVVICKDLVNVSDEALQGRPDEFTVGLLHRTVADFIFSNSTSKVIEKRLGAAEGSLGLYGKRELVRAHCRTLIYDLYNDFERNVRFCHVLQLSEEIYAASSEPDLGLFHLGLPWLVACLHLSSPSYGRSSSWYIGSILNNLNSFNNGPRRSTLADDERPQAESAEESIVPPFNRIDCLVGTMLDRWPDILDDGANHVHHNVFSEAGEVQRMLWLLTCKKCWPAMIEQQQGLLSITHILLVYLRQKRTSMIFGKYFKNYCGNGLYVSSSHGSNKAVIGTFLDALRTADSVDTDYHLFWFWSCFISALAILDFDIQQASKGFSQSILQPQLPSNLDEIIRIMLASKTPQYLPVLPHQNALALFESRAPGSTEKTLVPHEDWRHSGFGKVNVAKLLKAIAGISIVDGEVQATFVAAKARKNSDGYMFSIFGEMSAAQKYFF